MIEHKNKKTKPWLIISICVVVVLLISDAFFIGNVAYLLKWRECGSKPVLARRSVTLFASGPEHSFINAHPGFFEEKTGLLQVGNPQLFCTETDASKSYIK